ncbi:MULTISPECIES: 2,3-dihydro-2,3-dihydroxybenzoate dehydrogenase [unclassified Modicisalibacter]|uniref:2,3-dihydro-2,3-dihydroxybenzoate dehydrogenase n=1 Tax=unclassified Modicisalibacter TaxID=2679913 RepID=UPI001CCE1F12|nr:MULTISPECIES: 2,3-dihydro-2,3-dihydroxybenzoate dehydrogenase [unclassified Modicisalibacter]MBZ9558535.1 2,3-dihydro-2,3-dihydroxybenzoate dehydrogenase [Modicisalibacter sp. R2A 31.J]MBZ9575573.1 2,3-dihydro-2,3-dihydroxybenzoate dehydrogenase [Modicisalibacter sp. MOD 31.J]
MTARALTYDDLAGKRVLVAGAASGIGRCVAERFVEQGADVVGFDRNVDGREVTFRLLPVDIGEHAQVAEACAHLQDESPHLDVLVNAAGILRLGRTEELTLEDWHACLNVNATGAFHLLRQWLPLFKRQRRGAVIHVASNAAHVPRIGMAAYCASKAALASLSHCVGLELAPYGVRCNLVSPGSTDTPMLHDMCPTPADRQRLLQGQTERYKLGIPLGKLATPDDIADAIVFLASERAGHITLQDLVIDGGATLGA